MNRAARGPVRRRPELGDPVRVVRTVFGCAPEEVSERVVVTPFLPLRSFRRYVDGPVTELAPPFFYKGFTAAFSGTRISVIHTGVGPSRVGDCLAFLSLTPARRVAFVGAVGGLAPGLGIGDWFEPVAVADGEGFARYLREGLRAVVSAAPRRPVPAGVRLPVRRFLEARGLRVHPGTVYTIGSIAIESPEHLRFLRRAGFAAVEMELSAFLEAASHHGLEPAVFTYVSDLPLERPLWEPLPPDQAEALRTAYRAAPLLALEWMASGAPG